MEIVKASCAWQDAQDGRLYLLNDSEPGWEANSVDELDEFFVLHALDENEEPTEQVAGIEFLDFLKFNRWDTLPRTGALWQLPGWEPLPLAQLLQRLQAELRAEAGAPVS